MKYFLFISLLMTSTLFAKTLDLRVEKYICGEIDPYIIGDACVLYAADDKEVYGLIIEIEDYLETFTEDLAPGDLIKIETNFMATDSNERVINLITKLAEELDSKINVNHVSSLARTIKGIKRSKILNKYQLVCHEAQEVQSGMRTKIILESTIEVRNFNSFALNELRLGYELTPEDDPNTIFSDFDRRDLDFFKLNKRNFNPTRYVNYINFAALFVESTKGKINLLLPKEKLLTSSREKVFESYLQMNNMYGRFGTTVKLDCNILRTAQFY
jgi:hypothetical protein